MKLLVTGAAYPDDEKLALLSEMGNEVFFLQNEKDALPLLYDEVEGIICNGLFQHHPIENFVHLKYIQITSAGLDRVPMEYINEHGIEIHNAKGVYSIPMAEFALSSVLQIYKDSDFFRENQKKCIWEKNRSIRELFGKNVCIIGCGDIGTECAKRFAAFGCNVYGVDPTEKTCGCYSKIYTPEKISEALSKADVAVFTLPLTEETKHIIDENKISILPEGSVIVNLARGGIIDTDALMNQLEKRKLFAALDVFEEEPLPENSPFWNMENVLVTPHNSFVGENNRERLWKMIENNLKERVHR